MSDYHETTVGTTLQGVNVPASQPVTPEEIARRTALFDKVLRLREEIGLIGVPIDELVRQGREELDADE